FGLCCLKSNSKKIQGGVEALLASISAALPLWRQHGALWFVINPLWDGLRALGFKERLLDIQYADDENAIKQALNDWHQFLSPELIWDDYQARLSQVIGWSETQQLHLGVHGKQFFPRVVHAVLSRLLGENIKASELQTRLLQRAIPPADLQPLWQKMGLGH
ncbi:MAG: hypothetical protein LRY40_01465, partial [Shewanella fodinae]|nr:hypothetical protein [Shewanella fodinae]